MVSFTHLPPYVWERTRFPIEQEAGWDPQSRFRHFGKEKLSLSGFDPLTVKSVS